MNIIDNIIGYIKNKVFQYALNSYIKYINSIKGEWSNIVTANHPDYITIIFAQNAIKYDKNTTLIINQLCLAFTYKFNPYLTYIDGGDKMNKAKYPHPAQSTGLR